MKKLFILAVVAATVMTIAACGPNRDKEVAQIKSLEDSIVNNGMVLDTTLGNHLVELYTQFADNHPDDPATPGYLFNAADISCTLCHYNQSCELLTRIIENYDTVSNLGDCYFALARAYEDNSDYEKAKETYKLFIDLFPDHPLAADIRTMLEGNLICLSPEEMLNRILEQNDNQAI